MRAHAHQVLSVSSHVSRRVTLSVLLFLGVMSAVPAAETVSISAPDALAAESDNPETPNPASFTISRAASATTALTVYVSISGTATNSVDYVFPSSIIIPANQTSVTVPLYVIDDGLAENGETVKVSLVADVSYALGTSTNKTITINDNEPTQVSLRASDNSAGEPGTNTGKFTVTRIGRADQATYVNMTYTGSALSTVDYSALPSVIYFAPGNNTQDIIVTALDDGLAENDETVIATLASSPTYVISGGNSSTVTINDDENPIITLVASDSSAKETAGDGGTFRFDRSGNKTTALTINYSINGNAANTSDYTTLSGTVLLAANATSVSLPISPIEDALIEGDETVTLTVLAGTGYTPGNTISASVLIRDNEPAISVSATDPAAFEPGTDAGQFTITRQSTNVSAALTVYYTVSGSAISGTDYKGIGGSVIIPANSSSKTITVTALDDAVAETMKNVVLTLTPDATYGIIGSGAATVEIGDNDAALPVVQISGQASIPESGGIGYLYNISANATLSAPLTVRYRVSGTATPGLDYQAIPESLTIPAGSPSVTFFYTILNDTITEPSESINIQLESSGKYVLGPTNQLTTTITDDDAAFIALAANDANASEPGRSDGPGQWTVTRTGNLASTITIPLTWSGDASYGVDYAGLPSSLTIPANTASATINLTVTDDTVAENNETAILTIGTGNNYSVLGSPSATINIFDDESSIVTIVANDDTSVENSANTGQFTISRRGLLTQSITIPLTLSGSAASGTDFTALPTSVTLAANAASTTITVTPLNDAVNEPQKTVTLTVGTGANYTVGSPTTATVKIIDDEPAVRLRVIDMYTREGGSAGIIAVERSGSTSAALPVNLSTSGSAIAGTHYNAIANTITIPAGATAVQLSVSAINDTTWRAETLVQIGLTTGAYAIDQPNSVNVVIVDNDNSPPVVTVQMQTPDQSSTTLTLDASGTTDPNGDALTYKWEVYGMGVLSTTAQLAYDFKLLANKIIIFTVSDGKYSIIRNYPVLYINTPTLIGVGDTVDDNGVLIVDNATLTLDGSHNYLVGRIINSGRVTHSACTPTTITTLSLKIEKQLFVDATSSIDVSAKGLPKGYRWLGGTAAMQLSSMQFSAGSYGGYGFSKDAVDTTSEVYGDFLNPNEVGSGGGLGYYGYVGNSGGGLIRLTANTLNLSGSLLANGQDYANGGDKDYPGGSGGGIYVNAVSYNGSGTMSAQGSNALQSPGGGGRIAVYYTNGNIDASKVTAAGGYYNRGEYANYAAGCGTVYIKKSDQTYGNLFFNNLFPTLPYYIWSQRATPWYFGDRGTTADDPSNFSAVIECRNGALVKGENTSSLISWKNGSRVDLSRLDVPFDITPETSWRVTNNSIATTPRLLASTVSVVVDNNSAQEANDIQVSSLTVSKNSRISSLYSTNTTVARLQLTASGSVDIDTTSKVDVSARGCPKGYRWSPGGPILHAQSMRYSAGSYGGYGFSKDAVDTSSEVYGDFMNPNEVGSGGGLGYYGLSNSGGGLIRVTANTLNLWGSLLANGQDYASGENNDYPGGSGGGIYVNVVTYSGTGTMSAQGSNVYQSPGGGGRVAIYYTNGNIDASKITAAGGYYNRGEYANHTAGCGTVYIKKSDQVHGNLIFNNLFPVLPFFIWSQRATPWYFGDRAITTDDPASFSVLVHCLNGTKTLSESSPTAMTWIDGSKIDASRLEIRNQIKAGSLFIQNGGEVDAISIEATSLAITSNSRLSPHPCTSTSQTELNLNIAGNLLIDSTSRIDATGRGCPKGYYWTPTGIVAYPTTSNYSGGSYGGFGFDTSEADLSNSVYGDFTNPAQVGSGGPARDQYGNAGGGLIRILAGTLTLNGALWANGHDQSNGGTSSFCGGSGGGIKIICNNFTGTGTIKAEGSNLYSSPGGGGRIAIYYQTGTADETKISAAGGFYGDRNAPTTEFRIGGAGSVYLKKGTDVATLMIDNKMNQFVTYNNSNARMTSLYTGGLSEATSSVVPFSAIMKIQGSARVYLTNSLDQLTMKTGSCVDTAYLVGGNITAESFIVRNNSFITCEPSTSVSMKYLNMSLSGNLTLDASSQINVLGKGAPRGHKWTPTGIVSRSSTYSGGSYGGYGLSYATFNGGNDVTNEVYGIFDNPYEVGSGGGYDNFDGAAGGGLVRISCNSINLSGVINANGQGRVNGDSGYYGGASGGGVWLSTGTFSGTGTISANGVNAVSTPGGGGRIAVYYSNGTPPTADNFSAYGGSYNRITPNYSNSVAGCGTVYIRNKASTFGTLYFNNFGQVQIPATPLFYQDMFALYVPKCPEDFYILELNGGRHALRGYVSSFDADADGSYSWEEYALGTHPRILDTNNDGLPDGIQNDLGLSPTALDSDADGIPNAQELALGTDPLTNDTDRDGVPDNLDIFPRDPTQSAWPSPSPTDTTPPIITISTPANVVKLP
jgi:Calx-beta domain